MISKRIIIALHFFISIRVTPQWIINTVVNISKEFRDVSVVNENIIWALIDDTINNIYRTTNGGLNWQVTGSLHIAGGFITAVSDNHAWVSGIYATHHIYYTTNGGVSWINQIYYPNQYINFIKFFNVNTGFFVADSPSDTLGYFYTRNGGINWIRSVNAPVIRNQLIAENRINALDTNFIWICMNTVSNAHKFYSLKGGFGNTWQSYDYGQSGLFNNAVFKDLSNGLVTDGYKVLITTNGGLNWTLRNSQCVNNYIIDFVHVPGTDWVIANAITKILVSYDFCLNWNNTFSYSYSFYGDAKAYNSAWLSGNNGQLLHLDYNAIGIIKVNTEIPTEFKLYQNYPNPFNPATNIKFSLPVESDFTLNVFDITGRKVYSVTDAKPAGEYSMQFDGSNLSSGIYFYRIESRGYSETKKMLMIK